MAGSGTKLRVLCLHSFRTSGAIFQRQIKMSGFGTAFEDILELEYVDAPYQCGPKEEERMPDILKRIFPAPYHEWWNAQQGGQVYLRWEQTVSFLREYIRTNGPFDGILGFSQGGCVASLICILQQMGEHGLAEVPPLRFAILMSAQCAHSNDLEGYFAGEPRDFPVLAIIGEKDVEVPPEATEELVGTFLQPVVIRCPDGTHKVQKLDEEQRDIVRHFLMKQIAQKSSTLPAAAL
eukprot:CAMPEP_0114224454 /NCGR_PEP_ID=MMETSP0058-20121206/116_1 /TAXON_ID=36894 /ORGANISM="Pyramimonas parkeae, CCMP726" /LENGTH=235 /DNA_ID=CAMNT_0001334931 /DNA_START=200 /DNA_END=907 /DNA_ORIENTATION=+